MTNDIKQALKDAQQTVADRKHQALVDTFVRAYEYVNAVKSDNYKYLCQAEARDTELQEFLDELNDGKIPEKLAKEILNSRFGSGSASATSASTLALTADVSQCAIRPNNFVIRG